MVCVPKCSAVSHPRESDLIEIVLNRYRAATAIQCIWRGFRVRKQAQFSQLRLRRLARQTADPIYVRCYGQDAADELEAELLSLRAIIRHSSHIGISASTVAQLLAKEREMEEMLMAPTDD